VLQLVQGQMQHQHCFRLAKTFQQQQLTLSQSRMHLIKNLPQITYKTKQNLQQNKKTVKRLQKKKVVQIQYQQDTEAVEHPSAMRKITLQIVVMMK
jgi:ERCC4-type nuclease